MLRSARRFANILFLTLIAALFLAFSIANRQSVSLSLSPLPYSAELPVFLLAMLCLFFGVLLAGAVMGIKLFSTHRLLKAEKNRVAALQQEIALHQMQSEEKLPSLTDAA